MIIERGYYNNTEIVWSLYAGCSGQMGCVISFAETADIGVVKDEEIMEAFGFQCKRDEVAESNFSWTIEDVSDRVSSDGTKFGKAITWQFMFESIGRIQKFQYLSCLFKGIDKINGIVHARKSEKTNLENNNSMEDK